ncbi:hypothetical protein PRJ_4127 [Pseudomonas sp. XWY-1]|nr:hypothetical protein PRJ_4127 [Pseudomonas sp. XWY-1]
MLLGHGWGLLYSCAGLFAGKPAPTGTAPSSRVNPLLQVQRCLRG